MRKIIERCPACGGELLVTRMDCRQCDTRVEGKFRGTVFDRLSPESLAFAELFVRLKGNTKQMERELDMPYSTLRSKLDDVVQELGPAQTTVGEEPLAATEYQENVREAMAREFEASEGDDQDTRGRQEILDRLERGEISADEAISELGGEKK